MKIWRTAVGLVALLFCLTQPAAAQGDVNNGLKWFEQLRPIIKATAWQADVEISMQGQPDLPKPMSFFMAMRDGNSRMELDLAKLLASQGISAETMPAGMGKMVAIVRPDRKKLTVSLSPLNAYYEQTLTAQPAAAGNEKIERSADGQETIDGVKCQKFRHLVTSADGEQARVTTWEADSFRGLPVKIDVKIPDGSASIRLRNIKLEPLAESQFEPPPYSQRFSSLQALMMAAMLQGMSLQ